MKNKNLLTVLFLIVFAIVSCKEQASSKEEVQSESDTAKAKIFGSKIPQELIDLNNKIKAQPANALAYNDRAAYYIKQRDFDLAMKDLQQAFSLDTSAMVLYNTLADYHIYKGEAGKAKAVLEKAISMNPKSAIPHIKLGELYFFARKYDIAFKSLNDGLKLNMYMADGYFWKGMIYKEEGDTTRALSNFQTAVEQNTDHFEAYMQLGLISLNRLKKETADYFSSAIRVKPENSEAWYGRAYYYQLIKEYDRAIQDYTRITEFDSTNAKAHFNLGVLHYELRINEIAYDNFSAAIKYDPKYAEAYYMRGLCSEAKARDREAIADFEYALSLKPDYRLAEMGIERVKLTMSKYPKQ